MHTVISTRQFDNAAANAGMTPEEIDALVDDLMVNPTVGEVIPGTGGCRKVRVAGRGKGKSGGYRVITYYSDVNTPLYLLHAYSKGAAENITKSEAALLKSTVATIIRQRKERK